MKSIIQRALPLDRRYTLIDKNYCSMEDGGTICENCGRPIANIATVSDGSRQYHVGFDCLDTFLLNNSLLDGNIEEYELYKKQLPTMLKKAKEITAAARSFNAIAIEFDTTDFEVWKKYGNSSYLTFYYKLGNGKHYNDNIRIKNDFLIAQFIQIIRTISKIECQTK